MFLFFCFHSNMDLVFTSFDFHLPEAIRVARSKGRFTVGVEDMRAAIEELEHSPISLMIQVRTNVII